MLSVQSLCLDLLAVLRYVAASSMQVTAEGL